MLRRLSAKPKGLIRLSTGPLKVVLLSMISLTTLTAQAHNVVSGAYTEGMLIEGEIGYSNGDMAKAGSLVKVFNTSGDVLDEIRLQEGGVFTYTAKSAIKHIFKSNLSAGHLAEIVIEAEELVGEAPVVDATSATETTTVLANAVKPSVANTTVNLDGATLEQLQTMVRAAVAQQVKPLQKELRLYKEKVMFRDIAGGLGFIFGLFGVAAWMASRRKQGGKDATVS